MAEHIGEGLLDAFASGGFEARVSIAARLRIFRSIRQVLNTFQQLLTGFGSQSRLFLVLFDQARQRSRNFGMIVPADTGLCRGFGNLANAQQGTSGVVRIHGNVVAHRRSVTERKRVWYSRGK